MSPAVPQFRRVNASPGLMIDVDLWQDAHEYHRDQLHLHHLALHGWGIVQGLEVTILDGATRALRIEPGLALDPGGNFVVVPEAQTYRITAREPGTIYLVLQLREVLAEPAAPTESNRVTPLTRVVEGYRIQECVRLPAEPYIELARVAHDPHAGPTRLASDPEAPGINELDLRARVRLGTTVAPLVLAPLPPSQPIPPAPPPPATANPPSADGYAAPVSGPALDALAERVEALAEQLAAIQAHPAAPPTGGPDPRLDELGQQVGTLGLQLRAVSARLDSQPAPAPPAPPGPPAPSAPPRLVLRLAIAQQRTPGWDAHRQGLMFLARELEAAGAYAASMVGPVSLLDAPGLDLDLVYLSGTGSLALGDDEVHSLRRLLDQGTVVVAEGCSGGPYGEAGANDFKSSCIQLAVSLGRQLGLVDREHPLLRARHVFGQPPPGPRGTGRLLETGGLVYSDADYGCAWQGGASDQPLPRGTIRDALELGVNMALFRHITQ